MTIHNHYRGCFHMTTLVGHDDFSFVQCWHENSCAISLWFLLLELYAVTTFLPILHMFLDPRNLEEAQQ